MPTIPCAHEIAKSTDAPSPSLFLRHRRGREELVAVAESDSLVWEALQAEGRAPARIPGSEDLIRILLAERKHALLTEFNLFMYPECKAIRKQTVSLCEETTKDVVKMIHLCYQRFARRIIFHEPTLSINL